MLPKTFGLLFSLAVLSHAEISLAGPVQDANKKLVVDFYELAFNKHKPTEAAKKYIGDKYIQHNPDVPNGAAAFYGYFEDFFKKNPRAHVKIHRSLADGDLVTLHLNSKLNAEDLGQAVVDIFRVENGKIVEHWDGVPRTWFNRSWGPGPSEDGQWQHDV